MDPENLLAIELVEASGPVSPKFQFSTTLTVAGTPDGGALVVRDHRDAAGVVHTEHVLDLAAVDSLLRSLFAQLPLGESLDLVGEKRSRKGVSFNHVQIQIAGKTSRLDYLLSALDPEDGDPRVRSITSALKALAT
jgi:hypothetical protein